MMKIQQVLWDWNGTLLDDLEYSIQVRNNIFPAFHLPLLESVEEYHRQFTFPVRLYYERAGVTDEIFDDVAHAWMAEYERCMDTIPLHEDASETVERFHQAGLRQTVLSASEQTMLRRQLALYGLNSRFDAVLGRGDIYAGSKEAIGREYLQNCGIPAEATVMIGDSLHDAEVARALDTRCVLVARGHQSRETLLEAGVPVMKSLREAADWVLEQKEMDG